MSWGSPLGGDDAGVFQSHVVPRYLQFFGEPALPMLIAGSTSHVVHVGCRTGYPATRLPNFLPGCTVSGVDNSEAALSLARRNAAMVGLPVDYVQADAFPAPLPSGQFTHAIALHPIGDGGDYGVLFGELYRLLSPGGQLIMSLPLRRSFPEIYDMLREYALRQDKPLFGEAVDRASQARPNPETLSEGLEAAGFSHLDVNIQLTGIRFNHGREFLDDPIMRLVVAPDILASLGPQDGVEEAMAYTTMAISKYWSEINFELSVNVGTVSARKL